MASPILLTLISALVIHLSPAVITADINVLFTNETIGTDQQLYYDGMTLAMQSDCNLVLYDRQGQRCFQSDTAGYGANCNLSFTTNGRLIVRQPKGTTTYVTPNFFSEIGPYAAVLRPDGQLAIYGPRIWSIAPPSAEHRAAEHRALGNIPAVHNMLFSGQVLHSRGKLTAGGFSLVMKDDCILYLEKVGFGVVWKSKTSQSCQGAYLRLGHTGKLAIVNDDQEVVWSSVNTSEQGEYVMVIRINGEVGIYGPIAWSTACPGVGNWNSH